MNTRPHLPPRPDELERQLAALTVWRGEASDLCKKALAAAESRGMARPSWAHRLVARLFPRPAIAALVLIVMGTIAALMFPNLGSARRAAHVDARPQPIEASKRMPDVQYKLGMPVPAATAAASTPDWRAASEAKAGADGDSFYAGLPLQGIRPGDQSVQAASDRQVVRKATIELSTDDVRGAFAKAGHLISEAGGEYVENSSLTGEGKTAQATLTMRIAAPRLGAVMSALGELGAVKSQNTTGEDVTAQVVDIESRIRNEQRVEQELLQLLDKRADAPLKDILELRSSLASVRESIERMTGQREKLGRLVSLASVLVVIRTADAPEKLPQKSGMGAYFSKAIAASWRNGLEFLADTVATGVALIVGGLVWWAMLAAAVYGVLRWRRRLTARCV